MNYGPDNKLPVNWGITIELRIPRYAQLKLDFGSTAAHENAICIYDAALQKILEKGNQAGRNLNQAIIERDRNGDRVIFITGWNKPGPANGSLAWRQSVCRHLPNVQDNFGSGIVGFEDSNDADYNDITVSYKFE